MNRRNNMSVIKEYIKRRASPYPNTYNFLTKMASLYREMAFLVHAIASGKLLRKLRGAGFSNGVSRQSIQIYPFCEKNITNSDDFREWLKGKNLTFVEGRWTFYIPPQLGLKTNFDFISLCYPPDAGLKILKDFQSPDFAKYVENKKAPRSGAALRRFLTPSPIFLVRVANYLYCHKVGMRVYDLVALEGVGQKFTCYVVQHVDGSDPDMQEYEAFIGLFKSVLEKEEISTTHKQIEGVKDFDAPNCNNNLIARREDRTLVYVDFQPFLLDEEKWLNRTIHEVKDTVHFGGVRFFRGGKRYLYQSIPGVRVGKRDTGARWRHFGEMLREGGESFSGKVVYDVGCNMGLMIYNALCDGARWGIGWDFPSVVECAERVLLALGATRFDLVGEEISTETDFMSRVPVRFRGEKNGILFFLAMDKHVGLVGGLRELPWKYMFYEGHANQEAEKMLENVRSVSWLKDAEVVSDRQYADGDSPERTVILLKREA